MSKPYLLVGTGISCLGAAKLLKATGRAFTFTDQKYCDKRAQPFLSLGGTFLPEKDCAAGASPTSGDGASGDESAAFAAAIVSPGIPPKSPLIQKLRALKTPILTEMDLAKEKIGNTPVIAITGTNGKSTICRMVAHILDAFKIPCPMAGNIGKPLSEIVISMEGFKAISLELSSYQLEYMSPMKAQSVILTNISMDHMERHGDLKTYLSVKWRALSFLIPGGAFLTDEETFKLAKSFGLKVPDGVRTVVVSFGCETDSPSEVQIKEKGFSYAGEDIKVHMPFALGAHNTVNAAMAAIAAQAACQKPLAALVAALESYKPLPFRAELIGHFKGFPIINDSKSTNMASTLAALSGSEEKVLLLLGGEPKTGDDLSLVLEHKDKLTSILAFGPLGKEAFKAFSQKLDITYYPTLAELLKALPRLLKASPQKVLFSPGGASFDEFSNFEERGRVFNNAFFAIPTFEKTGMVK